MENIETSVNKRPQLSIVIPCYNAQEHMPKLFENLKGLKNLDYEVIFIDDGSIDKTRELIIEEAQNNSAIKLIQLSYNIGAGNARNIGLRNCSGEYVFFLDADDFLDEDFYKVCEKAVETDADITMFRTNTYDYAEKSLVNTDIDWLWTEPYPINELFKPEDIKDDLFTFSRGVLWNKLYKRDLIEKNNLFFLNIPIHNDSYFAHTASIVAEKIYIMDEAFMTYCTNRAESISEKYKEQKFYQKICIDALYYFLVGKNLHKKYEKAFIKYNYAN